MYEAETGLANFFWQTCLFSIGLSLYRWWNKNTKLRPGESAPNYRMISISFVLLLFFFEGYKVAQGREKNYYELLNVSRTATPAEIKSAYRQASMTAHPDKGGSTDKFNAITVALEVLSDPTLREYYDTFGPAVLSKCDKGKCSSRQDYIAVYYVETLLNKLSLVVFSFTIIALSKYVRLFSWAIFWLFVGLFAVEGIYVISHNEPKEPAPAFPVFELLQTLQRYYVFIVLSIVIISFYFGFDVRSDREILRDIELSQQEFQIFLKKHLKINDVKSK